MAKQDSQALNATYGPEETNNDQNSSKSNIPYLYLFKAAFFIWLCFITGPMRVVSSVQENETLLFRNGSDVLFPLVELASESGKDYAESKQLHSSMLRLYGDRIKERHEILNIQMPPISPKNIEFVLGNALKELKYANEEEVAKAISGVGISIAEFLEKTKPFASYERIPELSPEPVAESMKKRAREVLESYQMINGEFISNESRSVEGAERVYQAARKAMFYLYLYRAEWKGIFTVEQLRTLRGDLNRSIFWSRRLLKNDAIESQKDVKGSDYSRIVFYCESHLRYLRIIHHMNGDDTAGIHKIMQTAAKEHFSKMSFR